MPELLLHGRNIPRLGDDVLPHRMPRTMRRPPLHLRDATDGIPDRITTPTVSRPVPWGTEAAARNRAGEGHRTPSWRARAPDSPGEPALPPD